MWVYVSMYTCAMGCYVPVCAIPCVDMEGRQYLARWDCQQTNHFTYLVGLGRVPSINSCLRPKVQTLQLPQAPSVSLSQLCNIKARSEWRLNVRSRGYNLFHDQSCSGRERLVARTLIYERSGIVIGVERINQSDQRSKKHWDAWLSRVIIFQW